jgi:putative heme iron utilization protein
MTSAAFRCPRDRQGLPRARHFIKSAREFAGIEAKEATMTSVDRLGFHVRLKTNDGVRGTRIAFLHEPRNSAETRKVLVEMVQRARQQISKCLATHAGPPLIRLPGFTPP